MRKLKLLGKAGLRDSIAARVALIAVALTVARLVLIHHYVDWRFLWGGDQVPVLNYRMFLTDVFSLRLPWRDLGLIDIPQLSLVLASATLTGIFKILTGPIIPFNKAGWLTNTTLYFTGLLVLWYAVSWLKLRTRTAALAAYITLALLVSYNPWSTIDTFKSYLGSTSLVAFLSLALFTYYLRLIRHAAEARRVETWELALVAAMALVLYTISPSAAVRGLAISTVELLLVLPFIVIAARQRRTVRRVAAAALLPTAIAITLVAIYAAAGYITILHHRVQAYWGNAKPSAAQLHPQYATPANALIAWTSWIAHSNYMPYHNLYEKGPLAALLYLWPLAAMIPTLLAIARRRIDRATRLQLLLLLLYAVIFIAWATAANPPLAPLKQAILTNAPILFKVLPPGISSGCIKTSYLLLIAASAALLVEHPTRRKQMILVLLLAALLATAIPIFNGSVFGQYYNEKIKGFIIPTSYRELMRLRTKFYEHILLLPPLPTYAATTWGWQGSTQWYHYLNTAILTRSLAAYSQYTNWSKLYNELTHPCITLNKPEPLLNNSNIAAIKVDGAKIARMQQDVKTLNITLKPTRRKIDIIISFKNYINISLYKFIEMKLCVYTVKNKTETSAIVFLVSGNMAGAHIMGQIRDTCRVKIYQVGKLDKPWPASKYNPQRINAVILRLQLSNQTTIVNISLYIAASKKLTLCSNYKQLLKQLNIKYIVIDHSIIASSLKNIKEVEEAIASAYTKIFNDTYITIYETDIETSPAHITPSYSFSQVYTKIEPAHIELLVAKRNSNPVQELELCTPMLGQRTLPQPLTIEATKPATLSYREQNTTLLCYKINMRTKSVKVELTYTTKLKIIYTTEVLLKLLPIPLFTYAVIKLAYLRARRVRL